MVTELIGADRSILHAGGAHGNAFATSVRHVAGYMTAMNATILWVIAAILVIAGVVQLLQGQIIFGIVLIVIGCLVGPGGVSIFNKR